MKKIIAFIIFSSIYIAALFCINISLVSADDEDVRDTPASIAGNGSYISSTPTDAMPIDAPEISAPSAIVMDVDSGKVLYEKRAETGMYPAGLVKLMTVLVTVTEADISESLTVSGSSYYTETGDGTDIVLYKGEVLPVRDAIYGITLKSGDDIGYALAEYVSGERDEFVREMNTLAVSLGCLNTVFTSPNSYENSESVSCAYDMALIGSALIRYPFFRSAIESDTYTIPETNKSPSRELWQENRMKYSANKEYYYPYLIGGKVGYSEQGGGCFLSFAEKDGCTLCAVVMGCSPAEYIYQDTAKLYDFCFDQYDKKYLFRDFSFDREMAYQENIISSNYFDTVEHSLPYYIVDEKYSFYTRRSVTDYDILLEPIFYQNPVGDKAGFIKIIYNGEVLDEVPIVLRVPEVYDGIIKVDDDADSAASRNEKIKNVMIKVIMLLAVMILVIIILLMITIRSMRKKGRKNPDE